MAVDIRLVPRTDGTSVRLGIPLVTATLAVTEFDDTLAAHASSIVARLAVTEAGDTVAGAGFPGLASSGSMFAALMRRRAILYGR